MCRVQRASPSRPGRGGGRIHPKGGLSRKVAGILSSTSGVAMIPHHRGVPARQPRDRLQPDLHLPAVRVGRPSSELRVRDGPPPVRQVRGRPARQFPPGGPRPRRASGGCAGHRRPQRTDRLLPGDRPLLPGQRILRRAIRAQPCLQPARQTRLEGGIPGRVRGSRARDGGGRRFPSPFPTMARRPWTCR